MHPSKIASNSFGFARKSSMLGIHEGFSFPCFSVGSDDAAVVGTKLFKAKCCVLPRKKELNNTTPCLSLAFLKEEDSLRRKTILRSVWQKERTVLYSNHLTRQFTRILRTTVQRTAFFSGMLGILNF